MGLGGRGGVGEGGGVGPGGPGGPWGPLGGPPWAPWALALALGLGPIFPGWDFSKTSCFTVFSDFYKGNSSDPHSSRPGQGCLGISISARNPSRTLSD